MLFSISSHTPTSQFIQISLELDRIGGEETILQLPAWRAGRYQLADYAQNIRNFSVVDSEGNLIDFEKISKNQWKIKPANSLKISYEYWAGKMDAGSAWVDDQQVYLNLVNCCFEVLGREEEEINLKLLLDDYPEQVSTLIPISKSVWKASNFQMLADSTFLAAKAITHWSYVIQEAQFHIWIHGEIYFDPSHFLSHFQSFTARIIHDFGEFPEKEYHFIFQLLPYTHYHGVEHRRGTVITYGPAKNLIDPAEIEELLGVSCHELYHAWNVCRIRPQELLPYDFSKETYTNAGLILEGVTTYMGDLYLLKSRVYDLNTYAKHLEKIIARESTHQGWKNYTIAESSFDLWLDGYQTGIPDRKVNIYSRGALLSFCLDILLIKQKSSLSKIMTKMWNTFGKPMKGYRMIEFEQLIQEELSVTEEIDEFFREFVHGKKDLFPFLKTCFEVVGGRLEELPDNDDLLTHYGVRIADHNEIIQIHPDSPAYSLLMRGDQIMDQKNLGEQLNLTISRKGRSIDLLIQKGIKSYYPTFSIQFVQETPEQIRWRT